MGKGREERRFKAVVIRTSERVAGLSDTERMMTLADKLECEHCGCITSIALEAAGYLRWAAGHHKKSALIPRKF